MGQSSTAPWRQDRPAVSDTPPGPLAGLTSYVRSPQRRHAKVRAFFQAAAVRYAA